MDPYLILDAAVFFAFLIAVVSIGIYKSRGERDSEDYFLAGRGLSWWLIGFSLIAANISTEQFVGMSGQAANYVGLAIASYEWMAAVTLVVVAFFFLPKFLKAGIYTIPEFLEYRFNRSARSLMSLLMMAIYVVVTIPAVIYSGALTAEVLFGDTVIGDGWQVNLMNASIAIGVLAAMYVVAGGLKACAWADLIQGSALIIGGGVVTYFAFQALGNADPATIGLTAEQASAGAIERFKELNSAKLHMKLPASDLILPWTALALGLWIPNFYYWGLNQYITQRTLGAHSLADGQKGVVLAAALKLVIPFVIVIPGIIAFNLFLPDMKQEVAAENAEVMEKFTAARANASEAKIAFEFDRGFAEQNAAAAKQIFAFNQTVASIEMSASDDAADLVAQNSELLREIKAISRQREAGEQIEMSSVTGYRYDSAFPMLMRNLVPPGLRGIVLAALFGAVISSLAAMLNAASTIFTMDLYRHYLNSRASQGNLVAMGRLCVVLFTIVGCWIAPQLAQFDKGIFTYIQEFQGFLSPGVLAVFLFGLFVTRAPRSCAVIGLLLNPVMYAFIKWGWPMLGFKEIAFLNNMAITFAVELVVLGVLTLLWPLSQPVTLPEQTKISMVSSSGAKFFGVLVILATLALYWVFF